MRLKVCSISYTGILIVDGMTYIHLLQWIEDEFLPYLDKWEESVMRRPGLTKTQQNNMLLSAETRLSLRMTCKFITSSIMIPLIVILHHF